MTGYCELGKTGHLLGTDDRIAISVRVVDKL